MNDKHLQDAFTSWNEMSLDSDGRLAYEVRLKQDLDQEAAVNEVKWRGKVVEERGIQKGIEKSVIKTASWMLTKDVDVKEVSGLTGLPIEQVQEIKSELDSSTESKRHQDSKQP